jgi:hypothetical protein
MNILHRVKAYLYDNLLTKDKPNDLIARVVAERSLDVKDICQSAVARGGADITAPAMEHAVNLFHEEMAYRLRDSFSINTGWYTAGVHVRGTFNSPGEKFTPGKHTLLFEFHQGALLRENLDTIEVQILGMADASIQLTRAVDIKTGSINEYITPGHNLRVAGHKIKIVGTPEHDDDNGLYFTNEHTGERHKVPPEDIVINNPSELLVMTPALPPGDYRLSVTTQYSTNMLKEPHTAEFEKALTVLSNNTISLPRATENDSTG